MELFVLGFATGAAVVAACAYWGARRSRRRQAPCDDRPAGLAQANAPGESRPTSPVSGTRDPALANILKHASTPPGDTRDPEALLAEGVRVFAETGGVSTLVLQRRLSLDFAQATILIEEMERRGYVSERSGKRPRRLLPAAYDAAREPRGE